MLLGREGTEMGNRISINIAKNIAESLYGIFFGIQGARARKEQAEADIKETEADMKKVEAYDRLLEFLEKAGFSEDQRKAIIVREITSKAEQGNMIENLQILTDLAERKRIDLQITGELDGAGEDEDDSPDTA